MNYKNFFTWLKTEKNMSERSARDTVSRLRRVLRIINRKSLNENTIIILNENNEFAALSKFIRSQLRRSVTLYQEFDQSLKKSN